MGKSISRYPKSLMELYSYIFESLGPAESKELLKQWILAIEGEKPPLFHQKIKNWPPIKGEQAKISIALYFPYDWTFLDSQGILLYILCGNHGRDLPIGKLNTFLEESSVRPSMKQILKMAIFLRKVQSRDLRQSSSELQLSVYNFQRKQYADVIFPLLKIWANIPSLIKR